MTDAAKLPPPMSSLSFPFRGRRVAVTHVSSVSPEQAVAAVASEPFQTWYGRIEASQSNNSGSGGEEGGLRMEIRGVEIQSVDMFGARGVGFVKIKADCRLVDATTGAQVMKRPLPGIVFLRGSAVTILVALYVENTPTTSNANDDDSYALLVEQPRVPIGQVACLELPAGMMDDASSNSNRQSVTGIAVQEIQEECGIAIDASELVNLTELALQTPVRRGNLPVAAIAPSPGGCDEFCRVLYLEKSVTVEELSAMRGRLQGLQENHGEHITLRVVPLDQVWSVSGDAKAIVAVFLAQQLRQQQRLAPAGGIATTLTRELHLPLANGSEIPQLAFGLYKIPPTDEGEAIILQAVRAGYRHFDGAAFYQNEHILGRALRKTGLPREAFYITSKVWNDAVKGGRSAVKASVEKSLADLNFGHYFDLFFVHWPVPGHFVEAYQALEEVHHEGKIKALGLSNFDAQEYEQLIAAGLRVPPVCNQFEVSPVMYRADLVQYFMERDILVSASKPLNRAAAWNNPTLIEMGGNYQVTPAQVMIRWGVQKGLLVAAKTSISARMQENRKVRHFALTEEDMQSLDALTTKEDLAKRAEHELMRKTSL